MTIEEVIETLDRIHIPHLIPRDLEEIDDIPFFNDCLRRLRIYESVLPSTIQNLENRIDELEVISEHNNNKED